MSRSNPTTNATNPCTKWIEWDGAKGTLRYYDKEQKTNVEMKLPYTFMVLDQLSTIKGWHDSSESSIYSNEIRDTKSQRFYVKAFKGGAIAEGYYQEIKDKVSSAGGSFVSSIYIAYKDVDGVFKLGNIQLKGASLNAWIEFVKANKAAVQEKAITITGSQEGKKGSIVFRFPTFEIKEVTDEANKSAVNIDKELQAFLEVYLSKKINDQVQPVAENKTEEPKVELILKKL